MAKKSNPECEPEITWRTDDLSREKIEAILGPELVREVLAMPLDRAQAFLAVRTEGAWQANLREIHAAYRSLARLDRETAREAPPAAAAVVANPPPPTYREAHWGKTKGTRPTLDVPDPHLEALVELGELVSVVYGTIKGGDTGLTDYEHTFERKRPMLCYGAKTGRLYVAGGTYRMRKRGIVG
jgi:hypothetical protein